GITPGVTLQTLIPNLPRPQHQAVTYEGCPAEGDGGDRDENRLKNRTDEATWQSATIGAVLALTWPQSIEYQRRNTWSAADRAAIAAYEGLPLQLEGYLVLAREEGPESCNCHSVDEPDFHLWLTDGPDQPRSEAVVVEVT